MSVLVLVVDTNLFHEFRRIDELPWEELGENDEIILAVTEPVQTELDEQKKSSRGRIKKRAVEWGTRFRQAVSSGQTDIVVREKEPRVIVQLDTTRPDTNHDEVLDRSVPDDRLVAIAIALRSTYREATLALFSDDLRPLLMSRQVSLDAIEIPKSWRREAEKTEEEKALDELEQQVALLRRQEPELVLSTDTDRPIEMVLGVYDPLTDEQIDELIEIVRQKSPKETNFERAKEQTATNFAPSGLFGITTREFVAATEKEISQYVETDYPDWIDKCRNQLAQAHENFEMSERICEFSYDLANAGTRPAHDLQVSCEAYGSIGILPSEEEGASRMEEFAAQPFSLPKVPVAPQGEWKTHDALVNLDAWRNRDYGALSHLSDVRTFDDVLRDQRRDPNKFYFRDKPEVPVPSFSLTCEQFRHAGEEVNFGVLIAQAGDVLALDGKSALVRVTCNAANLTTPETLKIPIKFRCEPRSTYDAVRACISPSRYRFLDGLRGEDENS